MRKLKLFCYESLDGFISGTDGDMEWLIDFDDRRDYGMNAFARGIEKIVMNQNHYHVLFGCDLDDSCMSKPVIMICGDGEYKVSGNYDIEYVTSTSKDYSEATAYLKDAKSSGDGDWWLLGDYRLIHALLNRRLVDEIVITRLPVYLENGARIFPDPGMKKDWNIVKSKTYPNGVVQTAYRITGYSSRFLPD